MARTRKRDPTYKSGLERKAHAAMPKGVEYEVDKIKYLVEHTYNPDFKIGPNTYIETKGRFLSSDRAKHLHIKKQHPEVKVYFLFGNADNTLTKSSKTKYSDWCEQHGYEYADFYKDGIPESWFKHCKSNTQRKGRKAKSDSKELLKDQNLITSFKQD